MSNNSGRPFGGGGNRPPWGGDGGLPRSGNNIPQKIEIQDHTIQDQHDCG